MAEENPAERGLIHTYSRLPHVLVDKDGLPDKGKRGAQPHF